jgi:hypothetical protein
MYLNLYKCPFEQKNIYNWGFKYKIEFVKSTLYWVTDVKIGVQLKNRRETSNIINSEK